MANYIGPLHPLQRRDDFTPYAPSPEVYSNSTQRDTQSSVVKPVARHKERQIIQIYEDLIREALSNCDYQ